MATELDDDTLQRYYDGDLSPLEERTVRARIEADPGAQRRLARLERLSDMLGIAAAEMGSGLDSAAMFAGIEADLKRGQELGVGERFRVIVGEWSEHRRGVVLSLGAAAAIAAAAVLMVVSRGPADESQARSMPRPREERKERLAEASPTAPATIEAVHGSQIENVDFGKSTGTVFEIENAGVKTAVVWITDEEEDLP